MKRQYSVTLPPRPFSLEVFVKLKSVFLVVPDTTHHACYKAYALACVEHSLACGELPFLDESLAASNALNDIIRQTLGQLEVDARRLNELPTITAIYADFGVTGSMSDQISISDREKRTTDYRKLPPDIFAQIQSRHAIPVLPASSPYATAVS